MAETTVRYMMDKIRGQPEKKELYLLDGTPRKIELSPNYEVSLCSPDMVRKVCSDWHFKEVKLPSDLLEGMIEDMEELKKTDVIFDMNHDHSLLPRIERSVRIITALAGRQLGYPYSKGKKLVRL